MVTINRVTLMGKIYSINKIKPHKVVLEIKKDNNGKREHLDLRFTVRQTKDYALKQGSLIGIEGHLSKHIGTPDMVVVVDNIFYLE